MRTVIAQWAVLLVVTFWLSSCGGPCCTQATCPTGCTLPCCSAGWNDLLAEDLSNAISPTGSWTLAEGVLERVGKGSLWTRDAYGDFVLDLEFKVAEKTNSGVFIRTGDIKKSVQTGIEIQVFDSFGKETVGTHDCGAVYDCLAPSKNVMKAAGQWNSMTITAKGSLLKIVMNGEQIIDMDLDDWNIAGQNPDGKKNKFKLALSAFPRVGQIGFQDHGKKVWYRNIRIKQL
ncbi:MAG: DUF1080 domain-containing protein [Planctomycetes bacterium]|nr:DUF1080 domain-containing protein [Planctomycetota bacterium]MCH8216089.1 DUF1080 domain-containing protein [Planctomycetota bacterium]